MSKIAIGLPLVGDLPMECVADVMISAAQASVEADLIVIAPQGIFPHDRARETIITEALSAGCDYLWFIDADTRQPKGAIKEMLRVLNEEKAAMVTGWYNQRGFPFASTWAIEKKIGDVKIADTMQIVPEDADRVKIDGCGLGSALIDLRWVRENLKPPFFVMTPAPGKITMFLWEDAYFCCLIRDAGGRVFGLPQIQCLHMGRRREITGANEQQLRKDFIKGSLLG